MTEDCDQHFESSLFTVSSLLSLGLLGYHMETLGQQSAWWSSLRKHSTAEEIKAQSKCSHFALSASIYTLFFSLTAAFSLSSIRSYKWSWSLCFALLPVGYPYKLYAFTYTKIDYLTHVFFSTRLFYFLYMFTILMTVW